MAYADGFLIPVPTKNLAAYKRMSEKAGKVWMEHGALDYKECWGDDMNVEGMHSTFPKAIRVKSNETVVFSWIVYASKAERNRILKAVMADPRLANPECPFDPSKMLYGGFNVIVDMAPGAGAKRAPANKRAAPKKAQKSAAKAKAKRART